MVGKVALSDHDAVRFPLFPFLHLDRFFTKCDMNDMPLEATLNAYVSIKL